MIQLIIHKIEIHAARVAKAVAAKRRRVLYKQGGYLKSTMQRSLRPSRRSSRPGHSPHVRSTRSPLRRGIAFAVTGDTVTCGPMLWSGSKVHSHSPLPRLLNEGGVFQQVLPSGKNVLAQVLPRPFTAPVFSDGGRKFRELLETEKL